MDVWTTVARRRRGIAEWVGQLTDQQADAPSWCEGWRVRDVLGHLVHLAEATQLSMARDLLRHGVVPDKALAANARQRAATPVAALADRLSAAANGRFHIVGTPPVVALGELLVHEADMARPLGLSGNALPDEAVAVLPFYRRAGRIAFHASPASGVTLRATDAVWTSGSGPEVSGRAIDLVLLLANRRQAVADLSGPGVAALR